MRKQSILVNSTALSIAKALKFFTPLILLPWLATVLGIDNVGVIAVCEAIIAYILILTDYGFGLTGTRQVAECHSDKFKLTKLIITILTIKMTFALIGALVLIIVLTSLAIRSEIAQITALLYLTVIGNVFYMPWLFQGLQDSRPIVLGQLLSSFVVIMGIFLFVRIEESIIYVPIIYGIGSIVNGVVSFAYACRKIEISFYIPTIKDIRAQLIDGFYVFLSTITITMYSNANILILSLFSNYTAVGQLKIAMTIAIAVADSMSPILTSIYAQLLREHVENVQKYFISYRTYAIRLIPLYLASALVIVICAEYAVFFIKSSSEPFDANALRWLGIYPLIQGLCAYGTIHFLVKKYNKLHFKISLFTCILSIPLSYFIIKYYGLYGAIYSYLSTTTVVAILYWLSIYQDLRIQFSGGAHKSVN